MKGFRLIALLMMFSSSGRSELEGKWLGVAGVSLSDGETTLLFDPVATKPELGHWLLNLKFKSDPLELERFIEKNRIKNAKGIFVSHTHFDHSVDAPALSARFGAPTYGGPSLKLLSQKTPGASHVSAAPGDVYKIGKFKITMIQGSHPPILHAVGFKFMPGPIERDFDFDFYDYREGEVWAYYVEHPEGNVLVDQGSHFKPENIKYKDRVSAYFVGFANKTSIADLVENNIALLSPSKVLPLHTDFFFLQSRVLETLPLPGIEMERVKKAMRQKLNNTKLILLPPGEPFSI